ncbi:MAG: TIGR03936 family radical SAM-associated protein [Clostridiales bacterium]|nr:TIGR03936 family radical SAM-associated protein [Clostridiales bacterium]
MRLRIKFSKNGVMRFVGHLDLLRYFQKAIRRAGIDVSYSEGFSPHQHLSFAAPLGLGLTSDGEYMDMEVNSYESTDDIVERLNARMAEGVKILSCVELPEGAKKAMAAVEATDYLVSFKKQADFTQEEMEAGIRAYYTDRDTILITKQSKKSERAIDLKPLIYAFEARDGAFFLCLSTGSTDNIKPELVLEDFYKYMNKEFNVYNLAIHRVETYTLTGGELLPLDKV